MGARSTGNHPTTTKADGHLLEYFRNTFVEGGGGTNSEGAGTGLSASGGIISDYTEPNGDVYRAHVFTTTGTFEVTELGSGFPTSTSVEYLVIAGGGGGGAEGNQRGGGGGAGGYRTNVPAPIGPGNHTTTAPFAVTAGPTSYTVTIGGGGIGGSGGQGADGSDSQFGPPSLPARIISNGGGGGGQGSQDSPPANEGRPGGSGGGGGSTASPSAVEPGGSTTAVTTPSPWPGPSTQGFAGGQGEHASGSWAAGGGGGGAGEAGKAGSPPNSTSSHGGDGLSNLIAGPLNTGVGVVNPASPGRWFAGGGACIHFSPGTGTGGAGGGGSTSYPGIGDDGVSGTGGGGASGSIGGKGGGGIVIVRYQIASAAATAKATGGSVSFYNSKTIHTFTSTGTFQTPGTFSETCEYVVVGGGGGAFTGGGGAGGYRTGTTPIGSSVNYTITVGGGGNAKSPIGSPSSIGTVPISIPGGGSSRSGPEGGAQGGASGGGGVQGGGGSTGATGTGDPYPGSIGATPTNGWGHDGGAGTPADKSGGGGGGAGGAGSPGSGGGTGIQLPTTFRDPGGFQYDNHPDHPYRPSATAGYFVAGGGSGTVYTPGPTPYSSTYPGMGGVGGGGSRNPADPRYPIYGFDGMANTGGGGAGGVPATPLGGSRGGSGLVLIAYPT